MKPHEPVGLSVDAHDSRKGLWTPGPVARVRVGQISGCGPYAEVRIVGDQWCSGSPLLGHPEDRAKPKAQRQNHLAVFHRVPFLRVPNRMVEDA